MTTRHRVAAPAVCALLAVLALAGCSTSTSPVADTPAAPAAERLSGTITVYGAASLTTTFTALARQFEEAHPGVTVQTTFAGSATLVTQIEAGAPADVFASADTKNMGTLSGMNLVGVPQNFATNMLEIAVPRGNPATITSFADLARPGVKTVICAAAVPCGAATKTIERATGITLTPVSEETAVTGVLAKVTTGEADAGLVYVTDVHGAGATVDGVTFAQSGSAVNTYPIAALTASTNRTAADAFVSFVLSASGRKMLTAAGFGAP